NNIEEIFQDETFSLEVDITNKGEADIEVNNLKVKLSGIEPNSFDPVIPADKSNTGKLEAVSEFNKQGGKETLSFGTSKYKSQLTANSIDLSFFAKIEYLYKTSVSVPKVCFKGDLNDKSLCTVDETKQVFSSAAPIQVKTAIERSAGSGIVSVELDVQNLGSGKVTTPDKDFDYRFDQLAFTVNPTDKWDCKAGGKVDEARLDSTGKATISCRLKAEKKLQKSDLYEQELGLTLNYKYRDIINKPLRVKKQIQ
ncbi:MAG: hypothetical protein AABY14_05030, partial [Nanoarchaeota archaeon]